MRQLEGTAARLRVRSELVAPHALDSLWPATPAYPLDGFDAAANVRPGEPQVDEHGALVRQALLSRTRLLALRTARGWSRQGLADEVTALDPAQPCARQTIERLEDTGTLPRAVLVLARIDTVCGAGGRVGIERVTAHEDGRWRPLPGRSPLRRWRVDFPAWWVGPVWLQAVARAGPREPTDMRLLWGDWARQQPGSGGLVVTTRKAPAKDGRPASEPLLVGLPDGWRLVAGVGAVPAALDVGDGWRPRNPLAAVRLVREAVGAVEKARAGSRAGGGPPGDGDFAGGGPPG